MPVPYTLTRTPAAVLAEVDALLATHEKACAGTPDDCPEHDSIMARRVAAHDAVDGEEYDECDVCHGPLLAGDEPGSITLSGTDVMVCSERCTDMAAAQDMVDAGEPAVDLDTLDAVLTLHGVPHHIEHTGGGCRAMVATNGTDTLVSTDDDTVWWSAMYPGDTWRAGAAEDGIEVTDDTLAGVVRRYVEFTGVTR